MPTGYAYKKSTGRWEKTSVTKAFDYLETDLSSGALIISFFRAFPDRLLDLIESPNADFTLAFPQRVILRSMFYFRKNVTTSSRGIGKTYIEVLAGMLHGILYPGEIMRQYAPGLKQGAELASKAFHQIEKNYPILATCWKIKSETKENFAIVTDYGSEYAIGAIQGGNCHQLFIEEMAQETEPKFDFANYESKVIPTCRLTRKVNKKIDRTHISPHYNYINNAGRRQNPAFYKFRADALNSMRTKPFGEGWVCDISWEISILFGIRTKEYIEEAKNSMTKEDFLRQMCAIYTGATENPMVSDEDLSSSRCLMMMESKHCGDPNVIYIVGHDVSYEEGTKNAKCADVVMKLTPIGKADSTLKRDKYRKDIVWVDSYPPPKDHSQAARRIKDLWLRFTLDGANATWIAIDSWQYGNAVMKELIKPSLDGINLCCYRHYEAQELEQPGALDIIYPVKAGGVGVRDNDYDMVQYMRVEFEQGNIRLLTSDVNNGLEQYKLKNHIKDDFADGKILLPYYKTNELCEQIQNLQVVPSGKGFREKRVSKSIQRDNWSALKYCGRVAFILEEKLAQSRARTESSWTKAITSGTVPGAIRMGARDNARANLLSMRRR